MHVKQDDFLFFDNVSYVAGSPFDHSGGTDVKWKSLISNLLSLISMSRRSLEHQSRQSQTATECIWEVKSPQILSIPGLPAAVSLTCDEMCKTRYLYCFYHLFFFLRHFTIFHIVDICLFFMTTPFYSKIRASVILCVPLNHLTMV